MTNQSTDDMDRLEHGEKVTLDTEFEVTEEFEDTPSPDGSPTTEVFYEGVYIRVPKSEVTRVDRGGE